MAKQKGIIKIKGTIGDMTFYKTADGHIVKEKSEISKQKIMTGASFARTRENMSEFGRAGKASKTLRNAIRTHLLNAKDGRVVSRLTKEMMRVLQADATSVRGLRNVIDGETEMLQNFNFNLQAIWSATMFAPYTMGIDRATGQLSVDIPAFSPSQMIVAPDGSTHFKIVSAGSSVNFTDDTFVTREFETAVLPWTPANTAAINIVHGLPPAGTDPLFLLLGIQFFQEVNGVHYPLRNGAFNSLNIVAVSGV